MEPVVPEQTGFRVWLLIEAMCWFVSFLIFYYITISYGLIYILATVFFTVHWSLHAQLMHQYMYGQFTSCISIIWSSRGSFWSDRLSPTCVAIEYRLSLWARPMSNSNVVSSGLCYVVTWPELYYTYIRRPVTANVNARIHPKKTVIHACWRIHVYR